MNNLREIVKAADLKPNRQRENVFRRVAMARVIKDNNPTIKLREIGALIGHDHSSISHYMKKHEIEIVYDDYRNVYNEINQLYDKMAKQNREEEKLQIEFYKYFHNTYPEHRGLLVYNLNNPRNAIDGHQAKLMGLRKSRPDMELYWKGRVYLLELKTPTTKPSSDQLEYHKLLRLQGFSVEVARTLEECISWLERIVGKPM